MKRLLLMGTALLSIAPYAGAMNSDQKDSKQKRALQDLQPDNQESSKRGKILQDLQNNIPILSHSINNNNVLLPSGDKDESDAFTTSELTSSSNTTNPIYENLIKALFDHDDISKEDFLNQLETFKQEYNNQNLNFKILKNEMIAFFNNIKEESSALTKPLQDVHKKKQEIQKQPLDRINLKDLETKKSQPNSLNEDMTELPPPPYSINNNNAPLPPVKESSASTFIDLSPPPSPIPSINNNNAPLPPVKESSASTVTDEMKSEIWNNYFNNLSNQITGPSNYRELNECFDATAVDGKVIISPSDWKDGGSKILDILENFEDTSINQHNLSKIDLNVFYLYCMTHIRYQGFELKAAEQVKRLYDIIHNKDFIFTNSNLNIIQKLFTIFIEQQNAQISEDLVSALLKDQRRSKTYLSSFTIGYLIATGKGSLKDMNFPENILQTDLQRLKQIVQTVIQQHMKELIYKTISEENKKLVDKKISIIQTNVIEPLKNKGLFEKLISLETETFPPSLAEIVSDYKHSSLYTNCLDYLVTHGLEKPKDSIEHLYFEKLRPFFLIPD